jgi:hypothetical protein
MNRIHTTFNNVNESQKIFDERNIKEKCTFRMYDFIDIKVKKPNQHMVFKI